MRYLHTMVRITDVGASLAFFRDLLRFLQLIAGHLIIDGEVGRDQSATTIAALAGTNLLSQSVGDVLQSARHRISRRSKALTDDQSR